MKPEDVDLESHVGVDPGRVDEPARARLAEFVANREQRLGQLRERALDAEQEVRVLQNRVQSLQEQVETLEQGTSPAGPALDTESLVATFGDALSSERLSQSGFTVSDLSVDLRANVVTTDEGLRVSLPDPGSRPAPEGLSELRFSVRSDPDADEPDLEEVPDLVGMTEDGARETLHEAGFTVGTVDAVTADAEPGRVVDQLPSPYSLTDPGAPVDLEVAEPAEGAVDLVGETFADVVRFAGDRFSLEDVRAVESAEPPGTVLEQESDPDDVAGGERLSVTISAYPEPESANAPDEGAPPDPKSQADDPGSGDDGEAEPSDETVGEPESSLAEDLLAAADEATAADADPLVDRDVQAVQGVGDTYGGRLRAAGIESLADLTVADPARVADAANVSDRRADEWIQAALAVARSVAGEDDGVEQR